MTIEHFFYEHPIFRYDEFASWKSRQGTNNPLSIHTALRYYIKTERLIRLRRELFAVVLPNATRENISVDPYLLAAKVAKDSILAYHTALELHGLAYSYYEQFIFLTHQKIKPFAFKDQWFQPVIMPEILKNNEQFGVEIINRQGLDIKITNVARTFVDVLDRVEFCGGWEEVYRSISNIGALNINQVIEYALKLKNSTLAAKVGYFLEQRQGAFIVNNESLKPLLQIKPLSPQYGARRKQQKFEYIKKWNLLLPVSVVNRTWEEPNNEI